MRKALGRIGPMLATLAALFLASGALGVLFAGQSAAAIVATPSISVIDNAQVLDSGDESRITSAAKALTQPDQVYVVTARVGTGDLVDYLHELGSRVGWDGTEFGARTLVLAVGTDIRQMDMYYGTDLAQALDPQNDAIFSSMTSSFRSGDWGGGLTAGLRAVGQAFAGTLPSSDSGTDYAGKPDTSHTGWWVFGGLGVGALGYSGGKSLLRKRSAKRAEEAEARRKDELTAANTVAAGDLRARLDQDQLLVNSIADSPLQDQLERDLNEAQTDLRSAQGESDPDAAKTDLDKVSAGMDSIDRRVSLLRKASDWKIAWAREVQTVRDESTALAGTVAKIAAFPATPPIAPDVSGQLDTLETEVREERIPIESGLGTLMTIARDAHTRRSQADEQLASLRQARDLAERKRQEELRRKADEERAREQAEQDSYYRRGGGGGNGWVAGWILGSMFGSGRSRGGGWSGGGGSWGVAVDAVAAAARVGVAAVAVASPEGGGGGGGSRSF